jgi:hypothetical protein
MPWLYSELPKLGFSDIELCVFQLTSSHDPHPCVLVRKSLFSQPASTGTGRRTTAEGENG